MNKIKLTKEEKEIESALMHGEYTPIKGKELENIENALKARKKDITMIFPRKSVHKEELVVR